MTDPGYPYGEFDASKWVAEFKRLFPHLVVEPEDEDIFLGWFANAIMTGYDRATNECEDKLYDLRLEYDEY